MKSANPIPQSFQATLTALYRLRRSGCTVNVSTIALLSRQRRGVVACNLHALDLAGLVDSCRLSLTLAGLAVALACVGERRRAEPKGGLRLAAAA